MIKGRASVSAEDVIVVSFWQSVPTVGVCQWRKDWASLHHKKPHVDVSAI